MFDLLLSLLIKELTRYELLCEKPLYILLILGDNSRTYLNKPIAPNVSELPNKQY